MNTQEKIIVFLASDCESSRWVYNALKQHIVVTKAIIENPISKKVLLKNRLKRIGLFKVVGQVAFTVLINPILTFLAKKRKAELIATYGLDNSEFESTNTIKINSVNDDACKNLLTQLQPHIIVVNGTRIISKKILDCTNAKFINMHVGITPLYRGSHGGYWALYNDDAKNFGTTIHLVDTGVDTGGILKQVFLKPTKKDNFATYPLIQIGGAIPSLIQVVKESMFTHPIPLKELHIKGNLFHQPTLWAYLFNKTK
jgi:folate-dependent phosphoribosylglycinamide formyltransferase PurN